MKIDIDEMNSKLFGYDGARVKLLELTTTDAEAEDQPEKTVRISLQATGVKRDEMRVICSGVRVLEVVTGVLEAGFHLGALRIFDVGVWQNEEINYELKDDTGANRIRILSREVQVLDSTAL